MTDAPWLDRAELPKLRRKARRINWYDIGTVVKCSYDERKAGRFHILRPYDVTWEEVQRRQKENRLLKERERSRRNRLKRWEEREMMRNEVSRESAVMRLLTAVWMPVAELVEKIEKNRQQAFQYRLSDGKPLKPNGLRKLVHVALRKLEELGQIEIEMVEGPRGPVGMARKIDLHSDLENDPENLPAAYDFLHRETVKREADDAAEAKTFATAKPSLRSKARTHQIKKAVRNIRRERTVDDEDRVHLKRYSTDEQTKH